jgi:molybdate transport system ATP-binding protein
MTVTPPLLKFQAVKSLHTAQGPQRFDIRLELGHGRILAIYGPSGAGKTTLLRILAGLTEPQSGHIEVEGQTWLDSSRRIHLPTRHRSIGFVFQDFALFPNLTVRQQLEFALPDRRDKAVVSELLSLMELEALQHRAPAQLSGGQQQRLALARAIARRPRLLLLDEPLSALDEEMRSKLQEYLLKAHRQYQLTTLLVSHHLPEIFRLADEAIVLEKGRVISYGAPASVFASASGFNSASALPSCTFTPATLFPPATPFNAPGEIIAIAPSNTAIDPSNTALNPSNTAFNPSGATITPADTAINPPHAPFTISVRCGGTVINIPATAAEASAWHPGQQVIVRSDVFAPKILPNTP